MNKHIILFATNPPITLFWEDDPTPATPAMPRLLTQGDRFMCVQCGASITHSSLRATVDGSHRHLLPRSFGPDQEYGCFSLAPGCVVHGPFNHLLWTKAERDQWRMVSCAGCGAHLGWYHLNRDGPGFFLLILENLRADEATPEESDTP